MPWANIGLLLRSGNNVHQTRLYRVKEGATQQVIINSDPDIVLPFSDSTGQRYVSSRSPARRASAMIGQGIALDDRRPHPKSSSSPTGAALSPGIAFVDFDAVALAERSKLILKRHPLVVCCLTCDVVFDLFDVRFADREDAITVLP